MKRASLFRLAQEAGFKINVLNEIVVPAPEHNAAKFLRAFYLLSTKKRRERQERAAKIALEHGMTEGAHHKQWVIDQMLRALLDDEYEMHIRKYEAGHGKWDCGISP